MFGESGEAGPGKEGNFFLALAEVLPGVIYQSRISPDGHAHIQYMSEAARRILECEPQDLLGTSDVFRNMIHEEDRDRFSRSVRAQLGRSGTWQLDYRLVLPTGRVIWISSQASVVAESDGHTVWRGFFTDITSRKQAEQDLLAERERLALATEAGHIGTWDFDLTSGVIEWNKSMYEIHGVSPENYEPTAERYYDFFSPDKRETIREGLARATAPGKIRSEMEVAINLPNGERRLIRTQATVIRDQNDRPIRMVGITQDITQEKEAAGLLIRAKEAAESATKAKSEFLASMSHEIRTPMNAVLGYTELLKHSSLDAEQHQYLQTIETSGKHLLTIINDILDVSQIEMGKAPIRRGFFEVRDCVHQVFEMLRPVAEGKGLSYVCSIQEGVPGGIISDRGRLAQILTNLLGNAIKFTSTGGVKLIVAASREDAENWQWEFRISDTGPGISAEAMQRIFEPFFQEDSSTRRRHGGTGLGLSISRQLASLLGGSIDAESSPGLGSAFTLILHSPPPSGHPAVEPAPIMKYTLQGRRILVVEDNAINRRLCRLQLERLGCKVSFAEDGLEMIDRYSPGVFDAMLVDMQMPNMDGCEATERVRKMEADSGAKRTPIIAMTANVLSEDRSRCLDSGMDDYLSKPISQDRLESMLAKWTRLEY